ncbi:origin of replication binding protein [Hortaea werneckii]|nr:origin of replication binding protein [Hortaea werneckii]
MRVLRRPTLLPLFDSRTALRLPPRRPARCLQPGNVIRVNPSLELILLDKVRSGKSIVFATASTMSREWRSCGHSSISTTHGTRRGLGVVNSRSKSSSACPELTRSPLSASHTCHDFTDRSSLSRAGGSRDVDTCACARRDSCFESMWDRRDVQSGTGELIGGRLGLRGRQHPRAQWIGVGVPEASFLRFRGVCGPSSSSAPATKSSTSSSLMLLSALRFRVFTVCCSTIRVFAPRLQTNVLPKFLDPFGTLPVGYFLLNSSWERTVALPLMVLKGFSSKLAVM